ncbi:hypothetical protein BH11MYX1_BH11MYX1_05450 [soil metagenome]
MFIAVCDEAKKAEIATSFTERIGKFDGGPHVMAEAMEALSLCAAAKQAYAWRDRVHQAAVTGRDRARGTG